MLIRTMPDPMGQAPVRVPRQAMLRELDLTTVYQLAGASAYSSIWLRGLRVSPTLVT
jgi:hypothetical protein